MTTKQARAFEILDKIIEENSKDLGLDLANVEIQTAKAKFTKEEKKAMWKDVMEFVFNVKKSMIQDELDKRKN
jgi:hypothetical protein